MSAKRWRTDWRNLSKWSRAERLGKPDRASVAAGNTFNPYGMRPIDVLVGVQPGVHLYNGVVSGEPGNFNHALAELPKLPGINLWSKGPETLPALDLIRCWPEYAAAIVDHFHWAKGIEIGYYTSLEWLDAEDRYDDAFWQRWDDALLDLVKVLRAARPDWTLIGDQFHETPITHAVDGLFIEESPGHFGLSFDDHRRNMERHGKPENWVFELRYPDRVPAWYVGAVERFCEEMGCFFSLGRDGTAPA